MNNKNLLNLVLLLVVATLAFIIYQSEDTSTELDRLSNIEIDDEVTDITSLVIEHNGRRTKLEKNADNQWQITEPVSIAANNFRINSILKLATAPIHNSYPISQLDADKIGLGSTDASHTERSNNTTIVSIGDKMLRFGIISPVTNLRYIQVGETVYTIEDVYYPLLSSHFGTLVSLSLLPGSSSMKNSCSSIRPSVKMRTAAGRVIPIPVQMVSLQYSKTGGRFRLSVSMNTCSVTSSAKYSSTWKVKKHL